MLSKEHVSVAEFDGQQVLKVEPQALTLLALDFAGRFERDHIHLVHFPSNSMILVFVSSMPPRSGTRLSTPFSS